MNYDNYHGCDECKNMLYVNPLLIADVSEVDT